MPSGNNGYLPGYEPDDNIEEQQEARPPRRKKRRKGNRAQQYMMFGAFAIAAVLLVVCLVMIIRTVAGGPKVPVTSKSTAQSQVASGEDGSTPVVAPPVTPPANANEWNLVLVSPASPWTEVQVNENKPTLANVRPEVGYYFDERAAGELTDMVAACNAGAGPLYIVGTYRDFNAQKTANDYYITMFTSTGEENATDLANKTEPPAGQSEHHTGLAVDFSTDEAVVVDNFASSTQYTWLLEHCADYGFILRYPEGKEAVTGQNFQPYHFRYVGKDAAKAIMSKGITLEEYLGTSVGQTPAAGSGASASASGSGAA